MPVTTPRDAVPAGPIALVEAIAGTPHQEAAAVLVADELRGRGREITEARMDVADGDPSCWLPALVDALRPELAPTGADPASTVHVFGWRAVVAACAARLAVTGSDGTTLVAHLGDGPLVRGNDIEARRVERLVWSAAKAADAVVLDSDWAVQQAVDAGVPRSALVRALPVSPVGDPGAGWSQDVAATDEQRRRRLVAVGGVGRSAGTDTLLQAVSRLPDVELVVAAPAGLTETELEPARRWLEAEALRCGVPAGDVRLLPFSTDLLRDCDAVVDAGTAPGPVDGVLAAMAHRRAVLATDLGPRAEAVVPGTTGELVEPGADWRTWCTRIAHLLRDPFKLEAYGDAGYERSRCGFSASRRADVIEQLDERLARPLAAAS